MILEGSSGSWGTPNTHSCEDFVRFSVCLEQVQFFVFLLSRYLQAVFRSMLSLSLAPTLVLEWSEEALRERNASLNRSSSKLETENHQS